MSRVFWRYAFIALCLLILGGCQWLPELKREPSVFNPFPQLTRVAVLPFNNQSAEPTVDGREFALAYAAELQSIPGFEIVPVGVVEAKIQEYQFLFDGSRSGVEIARKLAQILGVDAVVVGSVTDFSPYYPPRCGIDVEWYSANPGLHPIPPGYALPWGTPGEEEIPDSLIFEAERALAREQIKTQEPPYEAPDLVPPPPVETPVPHEFGDGEARKRAGDVRLLDVEIAVPGEAIAPGKTIAPGTVVGPSGEVIAADAGPAPTALPADWPDPAGFTPPPPSAERPPLRESNLPVLKHVALYRGTDPRFTEALETYVYFRDEARFGGWQSYLQRSDDFIRFCCHLHIAEMLTARGGAGQSRVVWRWPTVR